MLVRIDHVGIACRDLEDTIARYAATFRLAVTCREVHDEQGVREAMLRLDGELPGAAPAPAAGASYIQLLEPTHPDSPVGRFLDRRGEGIHHVGYAVADVADALADLSAAGVRLIDTRPRHGSMGASIAFLHPASLGGVLTELVQPGR